MLSEWPTDLQKRPWAPIEEETKCQDCGRTNLPWWTETRVWMEVMGTTRVSLCLACFVSHAEAMGVGRSGRWQLYPPGSLH